MRLADRKRAQRRFKDRRRRLNTMPRPKTKAKPKFITTSATTVKKNTASQATAAVARAAGLVSTGTPKAPAAPVQPAELSTPLSDIGLPEELAQLLDDKGISTIGHIKGWTEGALRALGGVTTTSINIITARLADKGHELKVHKPRKK